MSERIAITAETKVGALLEAYPELEEVLIARVPEFKKLKNPILRKTVAKVATLSQAARIGGMSARDLVAMLRDAVGQPPCGDQAEAGAPTTFEPAPGWFDPAHILETLDADAMLDAGEHPMGRVRTRAGALEPGQILALKSSFRPTPLIDLLRQDGFLTYTAVESKGTFLTYIATQ